MLRNESHFVKFRGADYISVESNKRNNQLICQNLFQHNCCSCEIKKKKRTYFPWSYLDFIIIVAFLSAGPSFSSDEERVELAGGRYMGREKKNIVQHPRGHATWLAKGSNQIITGSYSDARENVAHGFIMPLGERSYPAQHYCCRGQMLETIITDTVPTITCMVNPHYNAATWDASCRSSTRGHKAVSYV